MAANGYNVKLETFEGPLDLLIHLIEKNQVRVTISDRSPKNVIKELAGYLALWH